MRLAIFIKELFLVLPAILISISSSAQLYKEGTIVSKTGDSLKCLVKIELSYANRIYYKESFDSPEYFVALKKVKAIQTKDQYFENVILNNQEKLVQLSIPGRDSLFYYLTEEKGQIHREPGVSASYGSKIESSYVLKKNGMITELTKKKFKEKLLTLLADCPFIVEQLNEERTKYEDLPNIIEQYNRCNN